MGDEALISRILHVVRPPAKHTTHATVASGLVLPDGPRQGKPYRWREDPVHAAVMKELDAGWDSLVLPGAVQTGKSLVSILVPLLRQVIHHRRAVVYAQPSQQKLHEAWAGKVSPAIQGAGLGGWLPVEGQGARGGQTPRFVIFRDPQTRARAGMLYLIHGGGKNEGAQASVSAGTILVDEVDSFQSAHRVSLIGKRADSFGAKAVRIYTSTVKADGEPGASDGSIVLGMYQDSTRSRLWFACPHCGAWQKLEWEQVSYDHEDEGTAADSVRYSCIGCAVAWTESDRQAALQNSRVCASSQTINSSGEIVGTAPRTRRFGLIWTALDSSLRDLNTLAIEHWRASRAIERGDHGLMRSFIRDQLCRPYVGDRNLDDDGHTVVPTRNRLAALSLNSSYGMALDQTEKDGDSIHWANIPQWVEHITVAADVQRGGDRAPGRIYFLAMGRGNGRGAIVGWGSIIACPMGRQPTESELHVALSRLDGILRDWAPSATIVRRGVDVGDRQDEIRTWLRSHPTWWATKGTGALKADVGDHAGWMYKRSQDGGWRLYLIETENALRIVHGELIAAKEVGSLALPQGLKRNSALVTHLCATVEMEPGKWSKSPRDRTEKYKGGPHHPEWQERDDYGQCAAYARALAYDWENKPKSAGPKRVYGNIGDIS